TLIPNPKYSPFHSLGFAQFSILWVASSCSFSDFLNQLSLDSSRIREIYKKWLAMVCGAAKPHHKKHPLFFDTDR
ncbi:hypothetical protein, partial [Pseudanabaena sp. SR411]|uniref:hypothetical protein n=1 Tax=Pseudanabaena sp. SR411 TaxID=1980935 RepID=UPI001C3E2212